MQKRQKEFSSFKNRETVMESSLLIHKGFNGSLVNQTHADSLMELDTGCPKKHGNSVTNSISSLL